MKKIGDKYTNNTFENIKHIDDYGNEYWNARELSKVLEYKDWRNFKKVIDKAVLSANNSISSKVDWVVEFNKPIKTGKGKEEIIKDYKLSRYICYLIVQNADPSKEVVALGQTYFAIQTRKQEITEQEYDSLSDDEKRFYQRKLTKQGNYTLQKVASLAGVKNMAEFHNAGYRGLYNGETADDIFKRKKLRYREDILDNMNEDELDKNLVVSKMEITALDGKNYNTEVYSLDAIIAVGYRINSKKATEFRIWATKILKEYMTKGFALNDERFINGNKYDARYFDELLERIKTIRVSERMAYQKITDLFIATAADYNPKSEDAYTFFKIVQNKLHFAICF